jgi:hypothetical protein
MTKTALVGYGSTASQCLMALLCADTMCYSVTTARIGRTREPNS